MAWYLAWTLFAVAIIVGLVDLRVAGFVADEAQALANGAARAGAMELDEATFRASDGATIRLDQAAAAAASAAFLADPVAGRRIVAHRIETTPGGVTVHVVARANLPWLPATTLERAGTARLFTGNRVGVPTGP
jgi:nucleoid-associated protein YgaU